MILLLLLLLLALFPAPCRAQGGVQTSSNQQIYKLYEEGRDQQIVERFPAAPANPPDVDFYRGLALARLGRLQDARAALLAGRRKAPHQERFWVEMAGVDFKLKAYNSVRKELQAALAIRPDDRYARNFLATLFFLENNLDAALENWNRIGQPRIRALTMDPPPRLRQELLARAIHISPVGILNLKDLRTTRALLDNLGIFPLYRFDLLPYSDNAYSLSFVSVQRNGWGSTWLAALLSVFRDLPTAIDPDYYNLRGEAINLRSQFRWDENKRRVFASISEPLGGDPAVRLDLHVDARNENWDLSNTFHSGSVPLSGLNMERIEFGPELRFVEGPRWKWQASALYNYRRFRNLANVPAGAQAFFSSGGSLEYSSRATYRLVDDPGRRFTLDTGAGAGFGRNFGRGLGAFESAQGSLAAHWFPLTSSDDYETTAQLRAGGAWGPVTLDQLYQLGIERDNDLWLRGIAGSQRGRKGNAPLGREFALANLETDKTLFDRTFWKVSIGPFFDFGRVADSSPYFGSQGWLWDPGLMLRLRVYNSVTLMISYGANLPAGTHAFYVTASR